MACDLWPVTYAFYLSKTDLGWKKLTKVETSWSSLKQISLKIE